MSDPAIVLASAVGLVVTSVSIVRDMRTQRAKLVAQELDAPFAEELAEAA